MLAASKVLANAAAVVVVAAAAAGFSAVAAAGAVVAAVGKVIETENQPCSWTTPWPIEAPPPHLLARALCAMSYAETDPRSFKDVLTI